jgi:uncharacterized membrane protein YeaQ/YmgE (transglycosylase-associated protein family)
MALETFVVILVVGLVAGTLAHLFIKRGGFGLVGDAIFGICGALVTGFMLPTIGLSLGGGLAGAIITATVGAVLTLGVLRKLKTA